MSAYNYVGAEGGSYPEVAARAVRGVHAQHRSPYYGYIRSGQSQKIYLFPALRDAQDWFSQHIRLQPQHDYAAVFAATNLNAPVAGMEHFMRTGVSGDHVGQWWPFFLGLPLGGLGGYFLRRWQEPAATRQQVPKLREAVRPILPPWTQQALPAPTETPTPTETPNVGGPWFDLAGPAVGGPYDDGYGGGYGGYDPGYSVGGPWVDLAGPAVGGPWFDLAGPAVGGSWYDVADPWVGAEMEDAARRQAQAQSRALIQVATKEVTDVAKMLPDPIASYWVWSLSEPTASARPGVVLEPTQVTEPYSTRDAAIDRVRELGRQPGVIARAVFDKTSRHWPNPITWSKSGEPDHEPLIAQYVASRSTTTAAGAWGTYVGAAIDDVRSRARREAAKRMGNVVGVIHTTKDGLWHVLSFRDADDADDWLNSATQDQASYVYAAYFDKLGESWPDPYIEKIGGFGPRSPGLRPERAPIVGVTGAEIEGYRARGKALATAKPGAAVVVVLTADGRDYAAAYGSLDDAIDALSRVTSLDKSQFAYAAAFDKATNGTAFVQQEEFGEASVPVPPGPAIPRDRPATTSGYWY